MNHPDHEEEPLAEAAALPRELAPPGGLEDRTTVSLAAAGLIGRRPRRVRAVLVAAAAVLLLAAGFAVGRLSGRSAADTAPPATPRFLLLLEGGNPAPNAAEEARAVEEYRAWALGLRREGRHVSGERLVAVYTAVPATAPASAAELRGFFIISAASLDEAVRVARTCPHTQRGGRVVVRPIDST